MKIEPNVDITTVSKIDSTTLTVKVPNTPTYRTMQPYRITQLVDISPESIEEIANAVVEKLRKGVTE